MHNLNMKIAYKVFKFVSIYYLKLNRIINNKITIS